MNDLDKWGAKFLTINKNVYGGYNFRETKLRFKDEYERSSLKCFNHYDKKLENSVSRARNEVLNIVNYNRFEFFFTQTFSSKYDRSDLGLLISKFTNMVRYFRKKYKDKDFYYVVVPEYHSDKKNWHLHRVFV